MFLFMNLADSKYTPWQQPMEAEYAPKRKKRNIYQPSIFWGSMFVWVGVPSVRQRLSEAE